MKSSKLILIFSFLFCITVQACTIEPSLLVNHEDTPDRSAQSVTPAITPAILPTSLQSSPDSIPFQTGSPFCESEPTKNMFTLECKDQTLHIQQPSNRRRMDMLLQRMTEVLYGTPFTLTFTTTSSAAGGSKMDENQYGILFKDSTGTTYAVRFQGQYFNLEFWTMKDELKTSELTNPSFTPYLQIAGSPNFIQLTCMGALCDLSINAQFAGRFPLELNGEITEVGIFAASDWDEQFGEVTFQDLRMGMAQKNTIPALFTLEDDLTVDHATFAQSGLSGAFNAYSEDGFHFSPLIPFGYYAAKANPSLANVAVSAVVRMEIDPSGSSSRYAGLICRSSQDGMYMAVIRADGTYSVFRDTPGRPFALLVERNSDAILAGTSNNLLKLECVGNHINFFINGIQVEALTDSRFGLHFGRSGLFTKAGGEPAADAIIFKDLQIEEIRE